jgi:hypothetical protein
MKSEVTVLFGAPTGASGSLLCVAGTMAGRSFVLGAAPFTIGRASTSSLPLENEQGVSKEHATIVAGPTGFVLADLESRNGTFVNGERVVKAKLSDGDTIQICGCTLKVALRPAASPPAPAPPEPAAPTPEFDPDKTMIAEPAHSTGASVRPGSGPRGSGVPVLSSRAAVVLPRDAPAASAAFDDGRTMIAPPSSARPQPVTVVVKRDGPASATSATPGATARTASAERATTVPAAPASGPQRPSSMSIVIRNAIVGVVLIGVIGAGFALAPWQKQSTAGRKVPLPPRSPVDMKIQFVQQWCPDLPCARPLQQLATDDDVNGNEEAAAATDPCYRECLRIDE